MYADKAREMLTKFEFFLSNFLRSKMIKAAPRTTREGALYQVHCFGGDLNKKCGSIAGRKSLASVSPFRNAIKQDQPHFDRAVEIRACEFADDQSGVSVSGRWTSAG